MDAASKTVLQIAFVVAVVLLLIVGGGIATGTMMSGGIMGSGSMGAVSWIWFSSVLLAVLGAAIFAIFFDKK